MDGLFPPVEGAASRAAQTPGTPSPDGELRTTSGFAVADDDPVASVHVLGILPHLDRQFEYAIPATMQELTPGQRVRVRFAGRDREGLVRSRYARPHTDRPLAPILKLVSPDVVIGESMFRVCEDIATRYAGSVGDVLRLAVPPRSAAAEKQVRAAVERGQAQAEDDTDGSPAAGDDASAESERDADEAGGHQDDDRHPHYTRKFTGLQAFLNHAASDTGVTPRAWVTLDPVDSWVALALEAVQALPPDAGALILASDQRDADRAAHAFADAGIDAVMLASSAGPHKRYSAFLSVLNGTARVAIGTRSTAFAPVRNLSLVLVYDPDDDLYEEPHAPYPHVRSVVQSRSRVENTALLFVTETPSVWLRALENHGHLTALPPIAAPHAVTHPRVELMDQYLREREGGSGYARLPSHAYTRIREGLTRGPVLVSVPRSGYVPALVCTFCGTRATCVTCHASLAAPARGSEMLVCRVCGRTHGAYRCQECDRTNMRPLVLGTGRTAEDLSRAFPDVPLHVSGGAQGVLDDSEVNEAQIVVATPGAEPHPADGFAASLIVDPELALGRAVYDADTEAVRRFAHVIALTRTFEHGGQVLVLGATPHRALRALVLPRSTSFVDAVLDERDALAFPPMSKVVEVSGDTGAVGRFLADADPPPTAGVFGPLEAHDADGGPRSRAVIRAPLADTAALVASVRAAAVVHSAKKVPGTLRVQVDPPHVF